MTSSTSRVTRPLGIAALIFGSLYYLQFGLQAIDDHKIQAFSVLVGGAGLGWAAIRAYKRLPAAAVAFAGTLPALLVHLVMTIRDSGEMIFLIGSVPAPLVAGLALGLGRRRPSAAAAQAGS